VKAFYRESPVIPETSGDPGSSNTTPASVLDAGFATTSHPE
jgi:hypothetical protein